MARVLGLKLQALYCSRLLSSSALASKHLDTRHIPWRCYAESALLTESCSSTLNANEMDGDSKDTNGGDSGKKGDRIEDTDSMVSDLDKCTSSILEKLKARVNTAREEKANGFQKQGDPLSAKESKKSVTDDKWQQVVRTVHSINVNLKAKAAAASDKSAGLPKMETKDDLYDFADLDFPEAGGVSGDSNASSKSSLGMKVSGKNVKQKSSQPQFSPQQKSKDTKTFNFLKPLDNNKALDNKRTLGLFRALDDNTTTQIGNSKSKSKLSFTESDFTSEGLFSTLKPSKLRDRNQLKTKDVVADSVDSKVLKGKDGALPQAAQDGSSSQVWNQSRSKDRAQGTSDFKPEGSMNPAQLHGKSEATYHPSHDNKSVPCVGYMVCIHNVPANSNPAFIRTSMATHGELLGFFKKTRSDCFNAYVQFKTQQAMESAIAARKLQIGGKSFPITRTDPVISTVVRVSKVNLDTTDKQLLSICQTYGSVDNIRKRSTGVYDVFYQVKELPNMTSILGSLNEVTHNRYTWLAAPAPTLHPSVQKEILRSPEGQAWHDVQVSQALNRIELGIDGVSVLFEDLRELTALGKEFLK